MKPSRLTSKPPGLKFKINSIDKGSFPLDHFHECDKQAKDYSDCVIKHQLMPKRCREFQVKYLECRMNAGLMEREEMETLGMVEEVVVSS